ncbi:mitochondrial pentatricopeptide repeat (PPR) protein [Andalucia godoyi]|uniref:Mitochondrial pentatricopeptide repeat (PPR) protein n=1 Tax=Andalucia godoyi TaxID=505711 RepID=A0A8K0F134_ANDGO|nr:mitochondrial pentatricopeptide repeat (PPR) protein [Andalucia godoyi]|eukprot:ANDGO_07543.mRNA.1 mitochondrial pentatricopeptide repeat (PPR) protein
MAMAMIGRGLSRLQWWNSGRRRFSLLVEQFNQAILRDERKLAVSLYDFLPEEERMSASVQSRMLFLRLRDPYESMKNAFEARRNLAAAAREKIVQGALDAKSEDVEVSTVDYNFFLASALFQGHSLHDAEQILKEASFRPDYMTYKVLILGYAKFDAFDQMWANYESILEFYNTRLSTPGSARLATPATNAAGAGTGIGTGGNVDGRGRGRDADAEVDAEEVGDPGATDAGDMDTFLSEWAVEKDVGEFPVDMETGDVIMKMCLKHKKFSESLQILCDGLFADNPRRRAEAYAVLMQRVLDEKGLIDALSVFMCISEPDVRSSNIVTETLAGIFCKIGYYDVALLLVRDLRRRVTAGSSAGTGVVSMPFGHSTVYEMLLPGVSPAQGVEIIELLHRNGTAVSPRCFNIVMTQCLQVRWYEGAKYLFAIACSSLETGLNATLSSPFRQADISELNSMDNVQEMEEKFFESSEDFMTGSLKPPVEVDERNVDHPDADIILSDRLHILRLLDQKLLLGFLELAYAEEASDVAVGDILRFFMQLNILPLHDVRFLRLQALVFCRDVKSFPDAVRAFRMIGFLSSKSGIQAAGNAATDETLADAMIVYSQDDELRSRLFAAGLDWCISLRSTLLDVRLGLFRIFIVEHFVTPFLQGTLRTLWSDEQERAWIKTAARTREEGFLLECLAVMRMKNADISWQTRLAVVQEMRSLGSDELARSYLFEIFDAYLPDHVQSESHKFKSKRKMKILHDLLVPRLPVAFLRAVSDSDMLPYFRRSLRLYLRLVIEGMPPTEESLDDAELDAVLENAVTITLRKSSGDSQK